MQLRKTTTKMKNPNKLIKETSPYLLQHAYNPVNWYPWSKEALEKAKKENKPIFLSIGYSTCHWCHVMEKESFEDEEIADYLDKNFISIKVDREERPDIDAAYMQFVVMTTGSGGWPLNVFLFPDLKPFFAGTYFPKEDRYSLPSFLSLLKYIKKKFDSNVKMKAVDQEKENKPTLKRVQKISQEPIMNFNRLFEQHYDEDNGGFLGAPKFPITLSLLLNIALKKHLDKVSHTLRKIGNGGICDHLAGGFSRYSTDELWLVPHFEKTLYDNALLLEAYSRTYDLTKDVYFKEKADGIYNYLKTTLLSEDGFYSSQDADSEGEEGKFYVFTYDEIKKNVNYPELFIRYFGITRHGNYEEKNILHVVDENLTQKEKENIEKDRKSLLEYRSKREHPGIDTKIIVSWNSLAISVFATYGRICKNNEAVKIAENVLDNILKNCFRGKKLLRIHGKRNLFGFLEDYSFLLNALTDIYSITRKKIYLQKAKQISEVMKEFFYKGGGKFSFTSKLHEKLYFENSSITDNVIPSATSMAVLGLYKLGEFIKSRKNDQIIDETLKINMEDMTRNPLNHEVMLYVLFRKLKI